MRDEIRAFAPASLSNLGPGFDILGLAVEGPGDTVVARCAAAPGVRLAAVTGEGGRLPREAERNTAGIAAREVLRRAGREGAGVELELHKGMPIGSGLGSSAASAAAAAFAVNRLLGEPLPLEALVGACVEAEAAVAGRHADNVAPSLLGGLVLVRSLEPLDVVRLPVPPGLLVVVATPAFELSTRMAREVLPREVPLAALVRNSAELGALVAAACTGDAARFAVCMRDELIAPLRAALIPGADAVMAAARDAGARVASISGAGPSIYALADSRAAAERVAAAMAAAFAAAGGLDATTLVSPAECAGAREL